MVKNLPVFLVVCGLFVPTLVLGFDAVAGRTFWRRWRATRFPTVLGTVTHSEVVQYRGKDNSGTYRPDIRFTYTVNGEKFESIQYEFDQSSTSDFIWAERIVRSNPVGRQVVVHYDPSDPLLAVLRTGLSGSELFLAFFLIPFNCAVVALVTIILQVWRQSVGWDISAGAPAGVKIVADNAGRLRIRLTLLSPFLAGLAGVGVAAFFGTFIIAFGVGVNSPTATCIAAGIALAIGVLAAIWHWRLEVGGKYDLVVDDVSHRVFLSRTFGRRDHLALAFDEIADIRASDPGYQSSTTWGPAFVTLFRQDRRVERLASFLTQQQAESFASWLKQKLQTRPLQRASQTIRQASGM